MQVNSKRQRAARADIKSLCTHIRDLAYSKGPDSKLPTVRDLCSSLSTHARAINDALQQLERQNVIYRRQGSGIFVSPKLFRKNVDVLFSSDFFERPGESPVWGVVLGNIIKSAHHRLLERNEHYDFHVVKPEMNSGSGIPKHTREQMETGTIHGIMAIGINIAQDDLTGYSNIPIVSYAAGGHHIVVQDFTPAYTDAIRELIARGCVRIGYWAVADNWLPQTEVNRVGVPDLYVDAAIRANGLILDPALTLSGFDVECGERITNYQEQGHHLATAVFGETGRTKPDAVIINDDMVTHGALRAMQELGVKIGEDVQIVTASNAGSPVLFGDSTRLIRVETDPQEIVSALFDAMDKLLDGVEPEGEIMAVTARMRC